MDDEVPEELVEQAELIQDDPSTDTEARSRQDAGWFKVYIECPECQTPMARTTTEGEGRSEGDIRVSEGEIRGICPECGKTEARFQFRKLTGPFGYTFPEWEAPDAE